MPSPPVPSRPAASLAAGLAALVLAVCAAASSAASFATAAGPPPPAAGATVLPVRAGPAEVVLLRGFGDVFSRGLDTIGAELAADGVPAVVAGHNSWRRIEKGIVARRRQGARGAIVLVGHSLGANAVTIMAAELGREGIEVDLLVSLAATAPKPVPANVRRAVNFYFSSGGWGEALLPGSGFRGRLDNRDCSRIAGVGHFNIEKQAAIQRQVVAAVLAAVGR